MLHVFSVIFSSLQMSCVLEFVCPRAPLFPDGGKKVNEGKLLRKMFAQRFSWHTQVGTREASCFEVNFL